MKETKEKFELNEVIDKEWIITNGIGGYASSTVVGANTRKYHGLLVAPIKANVKRTLFLSKIDESIEIDNKKYELYTNIGKTYITSGYKYQQGFEKENLPTFTYKVEDTEITKTICMQHGKNTVAIYYNEKNGDKQSKLTLAPLVNYRDIHGINKEHIYNLFQNINPKTVEIQVDGGIPIYFRASEGQYIQHRDDTFFNMFYIEEEKRGFEAEENHIIPGRFEIEILPNEEKQISIICSLDKNIDKIKPAQILEDEIKRLEELTNNDILKDVLNEEIIKKFLIATDNFIIRKPGTTKYSIIAGYHWFGSWMRDTLIAFEGLLLIPKRFNIAKEILRSCVKDIKCGLIPNAYSEEDNNPLYNSVDASLLLFEQVKKYLEYTNDYEFIMKTIYPKMKEIIENYENGIDLDDNNIYLDSDGLIVSGTENTQNTWMDAKYAGIAVTPRNGKAVEINALWYNALRIMEELAIENAEMDLVIKYKKMATKCKSAFEREFYNKKRKCLYDVVGDSKIRPNQLFAISLTYTVLNPKSQEAKEMFDTVTKKLLNDYGLKTLAKGEENYVEVYEGDGFRRDFSYHQGITWTWLLGLYYNALKRMAETNKYKKQLQDFVENVTTTFSKELIERGCLGSIAEIYDSKKPYLPKGAIAQAWSVAEVFRIIMAI